MALATTVIGSYPKPDYLQLPDWFRTGHDNYAATDLNQFRKALTSEELEVLIKKAQKEVLDVQTELGIDVITDGEVSRENYIFHFCRQLKGFNFDELAYKEYRNGACKSYVPIVDGKLEPLKNAPWCVDEWKATQELTQTPVKITIPGPLTIIGSTSNKFYEDPEQESLDLVKCINKEVRALAAGGCKHIQIDEPCMVRDPKTALKYGIDHLIKCFEGVGSEVFKAVHLCCGYPQYLDQKDYMKADRQIYFDLAEQLDNAGLDAVSIEDAHRHNDLTLLEKFKKTSVIFGIVAIADSRVETVEELKERVVEALKHIPASRLILAPDCGLGFLPVHILKQKIANMVTVAKSFK